MAAPQQQQQQQPNPIDQADIDAWKHRFESALADHTVVTAPSSEHAQPWHAGLFECFSPIDTCCITWCLPCITFGKTYHRTHKSAEMHDYNFVNTSCLLFGGFTCVGLHWIPSMFQRSEIRKKYGLQGDFVTDLLKSCCCGCCALVQQDKEVEFREGLLKEKVNGAGYQKTQDMSY